MNLLKCTFPSVLVRVSVPGLSWPQFCTVCLSNLHGSDNTPEQACTMDNVQDPDFMCTGNVSVCVLFFF